MMTSLFTAKQPPRQKASPVHQVRLFVPVSPKVVRLSLVQVPGIRYIGDITKGETPHKEETAMAQVQRTFGFWVAFMRYPAQNSRFYRRRFWAALNGDWG